MTAGAQEAQLAFKGATASLTGSCCCLVIDLGGRSTEFALGKCLAVPPQALQKHCGLFATQAARYTMYLAT